MFSETRRKRTRIASTFLKRFWHLDSVWKPLLHMVSFIQTICKAVIQMVRSSWSARTANSLYISIACSFLLTKSVSKVGAVLALSHRICGRSGMAPTAGPSNTWGQRLKALSCCLLPRSSPSSSETKWTVSKFCSGSCCPQKWSAVRLPALMLSAGHLKIYSLTEANKVLP